MASEQRLCPHNRHVKLLRALFLPLLALVATPVAAHAPVLSCVLAQAGVSVECAPRPEAPAFAGGQVVHEVIETYEVLESDERLQDDGTAPGAGSSPVHTEQRPHACGSGSSSACWRNRIRQPRPAA